ncbi:unnamed protein product [Caenorhabditis angaria]|uniref:Uncharacterized protein n=1 Tax=Caenorhabditis angaria TaxID=860376 RepID=A0A9P1J5B5_9PELO|nr:unnamed protein product [Caenorhabditis angaria]
MDQTSIIESIETKILELTVLIDNLKNAKPEIEEVGTTEIVQNLEDLEELNVLIPEDHQGIAAIMVDTIEDCLLIALLTWTYFQLIGPTTMHLAIIIIFAIDAYLAMRNK